jgi:hypothetical protein
MPVHPDLLHVAYVDLLIGQRGEDTLGQSRPVLPGHGQ